MQPSQESQASEASVCVMDRLCKLNDFLHACNTSPIRALREPFNCSSERTKRRYAAKANECLSLLLETMCPGESDGLKDALFSRSCSQSGSESPEFIEALVESYLRAETTTVRCQILSILSSHFSFSEIHSNKIPSVTSHKYYTAKKHGKELGVGAPVSEEKQTKERVDDSKLDHFLDFITSSHTIKDLPFGEKTLTLSTGELLQIPYVIRCLAPATIVKQYSQLCQEENVEPIGKYIYFIIKLN